MPVKPLDKQTVLATIHQFPSLEPLRFQTYPANHLHLPTRRDILHRAVVYEGDSTRLGTASTKTRYEVHGSRRKIRPQKGSGRARLGDRKSPMLRGGGVAFGPKPRDFATELPKKVYDLAWRTALSYRFRKGELIIVDNAIEIESPSPRLLGDIFKYHEKIQGRGRSLMVTLEERPLLEDALEQMGRGGQALTWEEVDVKNLLELSRVMIERDALHNILFSHQEDLTNKTVQPWHKSFIRESPPKELESILGWAEFRELQQIEDLDPKQLDVARPTLYEDVADKRWERATTMPEGPQRTELSISAYNLLAEAKELHFHRITGGLSWSDYIKYEFDFPRSQQLGQQRAILLERATSSSQVSPLDGEVLELEAARLAVQDQEMQHEAAILAAQVWEHRAEAQALMGEEDAAEERKNMASDERLKVDERDLEVSKAKLDVASRELRVATIKKDWQAQTKAQNKVDELTGEVERKENELAAAQELETDEVEASEEIAKIEGGKK
ncbi:hypothetical protein SNOG_16116 [Parastagonospora nodorum SN15]|nr:hypothetical protein SNOG_16116 [Parastagonospora nodorum SN15]EAT76488.2 hypothetical protein SNOG_16116 [Parastagonospora nodorum SN15]